MEGKKKKENVPKRDPYTLLYVGRNTKVIVITQVMTAICGLVASINQYFPNVCLKHFYDDPIWIF